MDNDGIVIRKAARRVLHHLYDARWRLAVTASRSNSAPCEPVELEPERAPEGSQRPVDPPNAPFGQPVEEILAKGGIVDDVADGSRPELIEIAIVPSAAL